MGKPAGGVRSSLARQTYEGWDAARGDLGSTLRAVAAGGAPAVLVEDRGELAPDALACLATALGRSPAPDLVYADEDAWTADGGRGAPYLKPGWSPELLRHSDYIGPLVAIGPSAATSALLHGRGIAMKAVRQAAEHAGARANPIRGRRR